MSDAFVIRLLGAPDAPAYRALRLRALMERPPAFGALPEEEPGVEELACRLLPTDDRCFFGAFQSDELVGILRLARYSGSNEKHRAYLAGMYVAPEVRRRGVGRSLVLAALDRARSLPGMRRVNLTVVSAQVAAIRLYESCGFVRYGTEREAFECDGRFYDEELMTLALRT